MPESIDENVNKKRGLGRGLGSLLGGAQDIEQNSIPKTTPSKTSQTSMAPQVITAPTVMSEGKVWQVGIDKLKSGTYQPREHFKKEALAELSQSIRENGILQPIIVRSVPGGKFEIVAGERRWRAAQLAGLHEVPVLIKQYEDRQALELAIIENVQREDLDPIEEAKAYSRLMQEFSLSQQQVAEKVGKERATVANAIRLLQLPLEVREFIQTNQLSSGHAKVLLGISDQNLQISLAKQCIRQKLSVRKLEKLIIDQQKESVIEPKAPNSSRTMNQLVQAVSEELQKALGTKVSIDYSSGKGKIHLSFYSDEELNHLVDRLKDSGRQ